MKIALLYLRIVIFIINLYLIKRTQWYRIFLIRAKKKISIKIISHSYTSQKGVIVFWQDLKIQVCKFSVSLCRNINRKVDINEFGNGYGTFHSPRNIASWSIEPSFLESLSNWHSQSHFQKLTIVLKKLTVKKG